jgi:outer membrane protein assembly factor BamB
MLRARGLWLILPAAAAIASCSGGGATHAVPVAQRSALPGQAQGLFTIHVPKAGTASKPGKPAYVSAATQSVTLQVSPNPVVVVPLALGGSTCPLNESYYSCSVTFNAPLGAGTMTVKTYASTDGTGPVLSMNSIPVDFLAGQMNTVNVALNGIAATLTLSLTPSFVVSGTASTVQAAWGAKDASGDVIIGPGTIVNASGAAVAPAPNSLSSSSTDFAVSAQPSSSPLAWNIAYDGTPTTVSPTITLSVSGFASVPVTLTVNPAPSPGPSVDWDSFGYDLERTSYNPNETTVGVGNVAALQKVWSFNVGYTMEREPVLASGVMINGTPTNVLYAGSNWGSTMYAINADTGKFIWSKQVPSAPYTCGGGKPSQFSIAGTAAIDRAKNRIYFADGHNQLHALDLSTGAEASGWPITIADYTPDHNFMHGGLTYNPANGILYAVTGSTCDILPWYGRIDAIDTTSGSIIGSFFPDGASGGTVQGGSGGGVWGWGGASIDPSTNDVFIATGNADVADPVNLNRQNNNYSENVVELSPTLSVIASNYPANIPALQGYNDFDFGATPVLFTPAGCPPMLAAMNKSGMLEIYDRGSIAQGPVQYIDMSIPSNDGNFIGVPAFDPVTNYIYVETPSTYGIYQAGLAAFDVQPNCMLDATTPAWNDAFGPSGTPAAPQTRSPVTIANGVAYISDAAGDTEYAFNAASGAQLWNVTLSAPGGPGTIVANGYVYVSASDGTITAYTLP